MFIKNFPLALRQRALRLLLPGVIARSLPLTSRTARISVGFMDIPGSVKTRLSQGRAELFSLFSSFDCACQSGYFAIQRNRDKRSTRKLEVGVFTQPRSQGRRDVSSHSRDRLCPRFAITSAHKK